ncbi:MAG: competence protein ComEC [Granulosicoccus sp.]|jgi:competence protein ComEC
MRLFTFCWLLWTVFILSLPLLPPIALCVFFSFLTVLFACFYPSLRPVAWGYLCTVGLLAWSLHQLESRQLHSTQISTDIRVQVRVASVPQNHSYGQRFTVNVLGCVSCVSSFGPKTLQLSWYGRARRARAGETWEVSVRLKPIRGLRNAGSFDAAKWAIHKGFDARGYVRSEPAAHRLTSASNISTVSVRESLSEQLLSLPSANETIGLVQALVLGVKHGIDQQTWSVLRQTGTSHLVAISGLHISLLAGWAYFLARHSLPRMLGFLARFWPAASAIESTSLSLLVSVLCACLYAVMAGFELPVQRALIMLLVWAAAAWRLRHLAPAWGLALAVILVLGANVLSILSPGFWLSFGTVALLFYLHRGRMVQEPQISPESEGRRANRWNGWRIKSILQSHIILGVALLPVSAWFFQAGSLVAPLANLLAVPYVGMVVVPLSFLSVLFSGWWVGFADFALMMSQLALDILLRYLTWLSGWDESAIALTVPSGAVMFFCLVGIVVLLAPIGTGLKWYAIPLFAPALLFNVAPSRIQGFEVHVLDVGQGLAALVMTDSTTLLFDTGGKVSPSLSMFESVVIPYLHAQGRRKIDRLVLSHSDEDHTFGLNDFLSRFPDASITVGGDLQNADRYLAGAPVGVLVGKPCLAGQSWQQDGVNFSFLHPAAQDRDGDNDRSCVLLVQHGASRAMITGDIERAGESKLEYRLMMASKKLLEVRSDNHLNPPSIESPSKQSSSINSDGKMTFPVDLLVAPHHGSNSSSGAALLSRLRPDNVVFSAGFLNRYGFPHGDVQLRYKLLGTKQYITGKHGAVAFSFGPAGLLMPPVTWLQTHRRFWHGFVNPACSEQFSDQPHVFRQLLLAQKGQTLCGK